MSNYSDNDLKTCYFAAIKGNMSDAQLACLFSISEKDAVKMKEEAILKFKEQQAAPPPVFPKRKFVEREKRFFHKPVKSEPQKPLIRPKAVYDNAGSQDKIDYYLGLDI